MNDDDFPEFPPESQLSSEELERVIRRAAELQTSREALPDRLDADEVMRIGAEVGLQESHLRRALLELRAESLVPEPPSARSGLMNRIEALVTDADLGSPVRTDAGSSGSPTDES